MSKTIKEIAYELGYSKTYISNIIKNNGLQTSLRKIGNKFVVSEEVELRITQTNNTKKKQTQTEHIEKKTRTYFENTKNADVSMDRDDVTIEKEHQQKDDVSKELFDFLREQIRQKDLQIAQEHEQLVELNERLKETIIMLNGSVAKFPITLKLV